MLDKCKGETRGDGRCNFDRTHQVCARLHGDDADFFKITGQTNWCGRKGRCFDDAHPNWCICTQAFEQWVNDQSCDVVDIDCHATDTEHLLAHVYPSQSNAHACIKQKCAKQKEGS